MAIFEAIVITCLANHPEVCRPVLVPGHEAARLEQCAQSAAAQADAICQEAGPVAVFSEIAPGVFAHRGRVSDAAPENAGDLSNVGFVVGETSVAVIDTGGSRQVGEQIYRAIRARTDLPIRYVILTHMHPDHVLGTDVFVDIGAQVVGHAKLDSALTDRAGTYLNNFARLIGPAFIESGVPQVDISVVDTHEIDLGGRVLALRSWPTAHTSNDLTVFDAASGVLFAGDLVFAGHTPALDGSLRGWLAVLDELAALDVQILVPGHGGPVLNWPQGGADQRRYLDVLAKDTRAALKRGDSLSVAVDAIAQEEAPNWQLFDLFNPRNATVAFTELEWE